MRRIGTLTDGSLAQRFCEYLITLSIDATSNCESDELELWNIWIRDEKDVQKARDEFAEFERSPESDRYQVADEVARIRDEEVDREYERIKQHRRTMESVPAEQSEPVAEAPRPRQRNPVTLGIIIVSVIISVTCNFNQPRESRLPGERTLEQWTYDSLSFVDPRVYYSENEDSFASVRRGELWRFITPMFLHGDEVHLVFNMLWIFFLGSAIERLHGSLFFVLLAMGTQIAGMMLQVSLSDAVFLPGALRGSPFAIGASGAVYGLFGFLWVRPLLDPRYPIHLVPMNIVLMLVWLVVCMTPLIDNVANGAHVGGLVAGVLAALVGHVKRR
jgi:GlpG protein